MSNYPNMSYCMFENTELAMRQILGCLQDAEENGELLEFFKGRSREETRAFYHLLESCKTYIEVAEQVIEESEDMESD